MLKNYILLLFALVFTSAMVTAQEAEETTMEEESMEESLDVFRPKPKNMWELGLHGGHRFIAGDVQLGLFDGFGVGLHLRKAFNYTLSARLDLDYGVAKGFDRVLQNGSVSAEDQDVLAPYKGSKYYRNYKTTTIGGSLVGILNLGNILFHAPENKWNGYLLAGAGLFTATVNADAFDADGNIHDFSGVNSSGGTISGRQSVREQARAILDGTFETEFEQVDGVFSINDDKTLHLNGQVGAGIARKITDRFNIGLEHKLLWTDFDKLDGAVRRSNQDFSNNNDIINYTTLNLNFNLGSKSNRVEPLYWVNPLVAPLTDLAEVKARPVLDVADDDGDGVINEFDQDNETPEGAAVDVRGVALDTDGDGIADYEDEEVLSPSGYEVDDNGNAIIDDPYLTESEIDALIDSKMPKSTRANWFLPMVHFDLDKYYIKPEFISSLRHVADVLKNNPGLRVVAKGYTDNRANDDYNNVLSYKRAQAAADYIANNFGVARSRIVVQYGGENTPLVPGLPSSHGLSKEKEYMQYMNRRVEFSIAKGEADMGRPSGPDAGKNTPGSSRPGSKYSGNRNSGY